jgi:hypothetical protein
MPLITKYAVFFDLLMPQIQGAGNAKIGPLDYLKDSFSDGSYPTDPTKGAVVVDLGQPAGTGTNVGFGMKVLKDGSKLPHSLVCFQMDDSLTAAPGTGKTPIEDALAGLAAWGGREISEANALALATHLFPAGTFTDPITQVVWNVSAPKLVNHVLKRDITQA